MSLDPEAAMLLGQPKIAPMAVLMLPDGTKMAFPQVVVAQIADPIIAQLIARTTHMVTCELLGAFEAAGVLPKGTLQKYQEPVPSPSPE